MQSGITMVSREELDNYCNNFLNVKNFKDYGPNGLQIEGSETINKVLDNYQFIHNNTVKVLKNIPDEYFVNLLRKTSVLVGNSSMGILEAPHYRLPVVNIGNRQQGRLNAGNVEFCIL